jgi:hypothetical protein
MGWWLNAGATIDFFVSNLQKISKGLFGLLEPLEGVIPIMAIFF